MPVSPERVAPAGHHRRSQESGDSRQLENLNEGQLRALLDEAVNYKTPKDREGKSNLFMDLLHKAEQDEYSHGQVSFCNNSGGSSSGKRGRAKRSLMNFPHSGSLQDLAGASTGPDTRAQRPQTRHRRSVPVSQRSYHGGSLPANVDQQNFGVSENRHSFLEDVKYGKGVNNRVTGGDYIATVRCVNPLPLSSDATTSEYVVLSVGATTSDSVSSTSSHPITNSPQPSFNAGCFDDDGTEMDLITSKNISHHLPSYTTQATFEIESSSMTGESAVDRSIAFSLVDTNHGCIPSPVISQSPSAAVLETKPLQLGSTYNSVRSVTDGAVPVGSNTTFPVISNSPLSVINLLHPQTHHQSHDSDKKNFDENYTSVQSTTSGQHTKKSKRKKIFKNETEILAQYIDGYRGNDDIDDIIKFIESDADNIKHGKYQSKSEIGINGKMSANRDKTRDDNDNDKGNKKRTSERRTKDNKLDSKIKRANSMEELSCRKFDDLTTNSTKDTLTLRKSKKSATDQSEVSHEKVSGRKSWCNDETESYYKQTNSNDEADELSSALSNVSITCLNSKNKKVKQPQIESDFSALSCDPFYNIETSEFQTVTKKKKIRKRHSPCDENRNRSHNIYSNNIQSGRINSVVRSAQEKDTIYKRIGHASRPSASSPPSDKSNDSNDDLDSVHSLPADSSGERLQASYADMARAAPPASPPPQPPQAQITRQRNFPDLIESCNYYSNDVSIQEKNIEVSLENTKNLLMKSGTLLESDKSNIIKVNGSEIGNVTDHNLQKTYIREQYPALESRQKVDKNISKTKNDCKLNNNYKNINNYSEKHSDKKNTTKPFNKSLKDELYTDNSTNISDEVNSNEAYLGYTKSNNVDNSVISNEQYQNAKVNRFVHTSVKMENSGGNKPPDVVLPITEMTHIVDSRPAVIIMNEEYNRSSCNALNIDGITFGFDINEQLINGDTNNCIDNNSIEETVTYENNSIKNESIDSSQSINHNLDIDFPAINEKPYREYSERPKNNNEDVKHSKKSNRLMTRDGGKYNNRNSISESTLETNSVSRETDMNENQKNDVTLQGGAVIEARIGCDKAVRYLTPTTTSKDIHNLDKIVHYVGMAWEDIMKSSGDKIRYFGEQQ